MSRVVKLFVGLLVAAAVAYPISQEWTARAAIQRTLINALDANDTAALKEWPGSAESFVAMLHDRCMRANAGNAEVCTRYDGSH